MHAPPLAHNLDPCLWCCHCGSLKNQHAAAAFHAAKQTKPASRPQCGHQPTLTIADRFRRTGSDDNGNALRRMEASNASGFPCRHCLQCAAPGEAMLLGSYNLPRPRGIYWTPSPIFVHAEACERFASKDEVAPIVRLNTLVSVRAYDASDQCIYELGQVCSGGEVDTPLERALNDARTAFVNVHTARPGCLLSRVESIA